MDYEDEKRDCDTYDRGNYDREKQVAIAATTLAAKLCEAVRHHRTPEAIAKPDHSPVTIADFGAQAIICRAITDAFPNDPIVAEEDAALLRQPQLAEQLEAVTAQVRSHIPTATVGLVADWIDRGNGKVGSRYWTLDPIDGTKGFLRGDQYAIALALIEDGDIKVGVLGCPALPVGEETGALFVAVRGQGTVLISLQSGSFQQVSVVASGEMRLTESIEAGHGNLSRQRQVAAAIGLTATPVAMDSQAKYGVVARGEAALYLRLPRSQTPDYRENIWDHAAGAIVVEEAGGKVTDIYGKALDFTAGAKLIHNRGIVASNGDLHDAVLAILSSEVF
ncbi:MAG TPA: 3'(2'),5'-bisphosphate nucleotidase [Thermosynechococcaceae cyanobacterium]